MYKKINSYFLIFIILFSMFPVKADAPIKYYEIDSDIELRGAIFVNVDPTGFYASLNNGVIQIDSIIDYNDVIIKFKGIALNSRLKKYNGFNVGYTHISHNGIITNELKPLKIDYQGFAYLNTDFSTVIINGMTGTTITTLTGLSGNQSISVPNGSSYDLNITNNQAGVWTAQSDIGGNYSNFKYKVPITLNHSGTLLNYQLKMNISMNDSIRFNYANETYIPYWNETNNNVWIKNNYLDGNTIIYMYYDNDSLNSKSNGNDVFINFDGFEDALQGDWTTIFTPMNYASTGDYFNGVQSMQVGSTGDRGGGNWGVAFEENIIISFMWKRTDTNSLKVIGGDTSTAIYMRWNGDILQYFNGTWQGSYSLPFVTGWNKISIKNIDFTTDTYDICVGNDETVAYSGADMWASGVYNDFIRFFNDDAAGFGYVDNVYERKYIITEPFYSISTPQKAEGTKNITASVIGDSNTQSYNTSQSREFTLTPTGTTNNILINTTSTDYDVIVITYWTNDITQYSQISDYGYVKSYINYTPLFDIDMAIFNDTINLGIHNFSNDDYVGVINVTINDSYIIGIRNNQELNTTAYNLIKDIEYLINFTIPYNNIFTLSNQSDTTAYLGISKQFENSTYYDPDNNPILSRLWNFGDNTNINTSNPTHIYNSLGNFNANYSVTEDATTNSQTITKEFNITVKVQPPQNVTTISHQTNISINWNNYTYADKYSVYELEDGFPYVDTDPIIDGIKDTVYNYAHEFLIFSPNPITHGDYGTIYPVRTALGAYLLIESIDNDDKSGDDDTIYYFDLDNDGLTADDPAWKITDNIVKKYLWDGVDSWDVTGSTNAVGDSTGGGTYYPIHELFIPVAELGSNWTNGSTVKVLVKREDSALSPDVITWYPYGNINNTDTNLWQEMVLNDPESYNLLANITLSNYTAINLTPFTIYHGAVSSWNGTTESDYTLFDVITEDIPFYNVSGYILDDLGNKLSGAIVYSCNGFVHEITQSDIYGYWIGYNFREGNYTICGNKSGYIDNSTNIYVSSNMTNINVTLIAYTITDWEIYQQLLLLESQNDEILLNMSVNNIIVNDKLDTILIFILLNMAVIVGIIIGKRGKEYDN